MKYTLDLENLTITVPLDPDLLEGLDAQRLLDDLDTREEAFARLVEDTHPLQVLALGNLLVSEIVPPEASEAATDLLYGLVQQMTVDPVALQESWDELDAAYANVQALREIEEL